MGLLKEFAKKSVVAAVSLSFLGNSMASAYVQPVISTVDDGEQLMTAMLNGELDETSEIKNISIKKGDGDSATFTNGQDFFTLENGIVLSTAKERDGFIVNMGSGNSSVTIHTAENPEKSLKKDSVKPVNGKVEMSGSIENCKADPNGDSGDSDVSKLIGGKKTSSASVLEFDINPKVKKIISFKCVFASQEVNTEEGEGGVMTPVFSEKEGNCNDAFGAWINGENKALLPKNGLPITVKNVVESGDCEYKPSLGRYRINLPLMSKVVEFQAEVEPGKDNHVKLAIADESPETEIPYEGNSAVFLNAQMTDAPVIPPEKLPETPKTPEKQEEIPENPKTSDINLTIIAISTLASVSGLVVLVNKYRKINEKA